LPGCRPEIDPGIIYTGIGNCLVPV
jgi:hypothetical protein